MMFNFSSQIIDWQKSYGRHHLPWQNTSNPYAIWVSEIMLQQTQVVAVIGYYQRFMQRFPDIASLANADQQAVMQCWSGLGYYARARNLHAAAQKIMREFDGIFPSNLAEIQALPGIGRSTAAAISTFVFNQPHPILDGNVKRVFARYFGIAGWPGNSKIEQQFWQIAERENPKTDAQAYIQGLMDLGATVCTRSKPNCQACPLNQHCIALRHQTIHALPTPKPRKVLPEKRVVMLVYCYAGEILLEKRPQKGIWGGLWSLPEVPVLQSDAENLPVFTHVFTHFKLHIQTQKIVLQTLPKSHPNQIWLPLKEALDAAIPTPIRKILRSLTM